MKPRRRQRTRTRSRSHGRVGGDEGDKENARVEEEGEVAVED
jgi:hypothetical protein